MLMATRPVTRVIIRCAICIVGRVERNTDALYRKAEAENGEIGSCIRNSGLRFLAEYFFTRIEQFC